MSLPSHSFLHLLLHVCRAGSRMSPPSLTPHYMPAGIRMLTYNINFRLSHHTAHLTFGNYSPRAGSRMSFPPLTFLYMPAGIRMLAYSVRI